MPLHYVRRLTVVSLLVYTNIYGSDMYYNKSTRLSSTSIFLLPNLLIIIIIVDTSVSALSKSRSKIAYLVVVVVLNSTCMYVSTCMHLYRTFIPYIRARVLVYLIFLLLCMYVVCSTYIIISLIPVLLFHILDL